MEMEGGGRGIWYGGTTTTIPPYWFHTTMVPLGKVWYGNTWKVWTTYLDLKQQTNFICMYVLRK